MAEKVEYNNQFLWKLREKIAVRVELSRKYKFYALAADKLRELLMRQIKEKYSRPN
jgi:hypothetical protein